MSKISRTIKHLCTTTVAGRRTFPTHTLKAIQDSIAAGEHRHRAQVRLAVEPALPLQAVLADTSPRRRARELFAQYRIWDTEENCGILIYINLADHKVEIVADRTVGRVLSTQDWQAVCQTMTQGFARGAFHESTIAGLQQLNDLLASGFPSNGMNSNELSNRPLVL